MSEFIIVGRDDIDLDELICICRDCGVLRDV